MLSSSTVSEALQPSRSSSCRGTVGSLAQLGPAGSGGAMAHAAGGSRLPKSGNGSSGGGGNSSLPTSAPSSSGIDGPSYEIPSSFVASSEPDARPDADASVSPSSGERPHDTIHKSAIPQRRSI